MRIEGKEVSLFPAEQPDAPLVVLNTYGGEGAAVLDAARKLTSAPFSLLSISNLDWDADMSPWAIPPIAKGDTPCSGGADAYLETLTGRILPSALGELPDKPLYLALAGYSLAGLFAVYAMYRTDLFSRVASASGSFWYPGFMDYVQKHELTRKPERIYFSLGNKEAKTQNRILQPVEENTRSLERFYARQGIQTVLEMNPGNHFQDGAERMAKGIAWMVDAP